MISRLHFITQDVKGFSHAALAEFACKGGAEWVQLRIKAHKKRIDFEGEKNEEQELFENAAQALKICRNYGAKLIINDYVTLAKEIGADGVHLGKEDMHPKEARKLLGPGFIIGGTANSIEEVCRQAENRCDYIGIGPYRFTKTKQNLSPVLGMEGIKTITELCRKKKISAPLIAIGGIQVKDVPLLLQNPGIHGVAVSSAINHAENKTEAAKNFLVSILKELNTL